MKTIAASQGLSLRQLLSYNPQLSNPDDLRIGQIIHTSSPYSKEDKEMLARLVRAEAGGEPYAGKVAVATVVLNRVNHPNFPNTIPNVIYETYENGSIYAFSPVENGEIKKPADDASIRAVEEAIRYQPNSKGSIYFYNPDTSTSNWITKRPTVTVIGHHVFAK